MQLPVRHISEHATQIQKFPHHSSLERRRNKQFSSAVNSTTSTASSTKYDPDLLKADVTHAKARVQRLRRELANIHIEMDYKQRGVETLNNVNAKFTEAGRGLTLEEAAAIRTELLSIQQSLCTGEREKVELMKSLACLKDDLTRLQPSESSLDVSAMRELEQLSTASQTDLSGEVRNEDDNVDGDEMVMVERWLGRVAALAHSSVAG